MQAVAKLQMILIVQEQSSFFVVFLHVVLLLSIRTTTVRWHLNISKRYQLVVFINVLPTFVHHNELLIQSKQKW